MLPLQLGDWELSGVDFHISNVADLLAAKTGLAIADVKSIIELMLILTMLPGVLSSTMSPSYGMFVLVPVLVGCVHSDGVAVLWLCCGCAVTVTVL